MSFQRLALIGCGLMGGSFALALRQAGQVQHVCGYSASHTSRERALQLGVIDQSCNSIAEAVAEADLVLLAVPVAATQDCLAQMREHLHADALVMDVGSTKQDVVQAARTALGDRLSCLVPAHPIAGKEKAGIEHADALLYQQRLLVLTPLPETRAGWSDRAQAVWQAVGSRVVQLTPEQHDAAFAAVSHLPHLAAFALMRAITQQSERALFLSLAGPGFRDFSRIAASDPVVWRDIFLANRDEVLRQSQHLRKALDELENAMHHNDGARLQELIGAASQARSQWRMTGD